MDAENSQRFASMDAAWEQELPPEVGGLEGAAFDASSDAAMNSGTTPARPPLRQYRTVFLSDIHLGSPDCDAERVLRFLSNLRTEHLVLVGDIVDFWKLKRGGVWHDQHMTVLSFVLSKLRNHRTRVTYLRGNHDDLVRHFFGLQLDNLTVTETLKLQMNGRTYLVLHGDVFDQTVRAGLLPSFLIDNAYDVLLFANRAYNWQRRRRGLDGYSIAAAIKSRIGSAMKYVEKFEKAMATLAREEGCDGVICGHIHCPADKMIDGIHYLNTGDWVESMTGIAHGYDDVLGLVDCKEIENAAPATSAAASHEDMLELDALSGAL